MRRAAIALVIDDQKVLAVTNRRHGGWGFPGGKCEEGETLKDACARELLEEVGLVVPKPSHLAMVGRGDWDGTEVTCFLVCLATGEPHQREQGTEPRWRPYEAMLQESPFADHYREMFPDGIDHFRPTRRMP